MDLSSMTRPRDQLLAAAMRTVEAEGPEALRARELTAEVGVSTMAVYTHFGGMPGLFKAVIAEGLERFAAHVRRVPRTDDPMADLIAGGLAYVEFASEHPRLYRLMFGLADRAALRGLAPNLDAADTWRSPAGVEAFSVLLESVERVIGVGDFRPQDPRQAALQVLSMTHGYLLLGFGGLVTEETQGLITPLTVNLMAGLGADREKAERSLARAIRDRAPR
jgi:AcrR family transcriptional regulator